jgi:hypothetical protein
MTIGPSDCFGRGSIDARWASETGKGYYHNFSINQIGKEGNNLFGAKLFEDIRGDVVDLFERGCVFYFKRVFKESEDGWGLGAIDADVCSKKAAFKAVPRKVNERRRKGERESDLLAFTEFVENGTRSIRYIRWFGL